jgi:hypothetical protein
MDDQDLPENYVTTAPPIHGSITQENFPIPGVTSHVAPGYTISPAATPVPPPTTVTESIQSQTTPGNTPGPYNTGATSVYDQQQQ